MERRDYIQAPNTKIALSILQLQDVNFKSEKEKWRLQFNYIPQLHNKHKILALILSKMQDAFDIRRGNFRDTMIFVNIAELEEIHVAEDKHPQRNIDKLKSCAEALSSAKVFRVDTETGEEEYRYLFPKGKSFMVNKKLVGYYFCLEQSHNIISELWKAILRSYGNIPYSTFELDKDAFLLAYYLMTNHKLAKKTNYQITLDQLLLKLNITTRARQGKKLIYPRDRGRNAIQTINEKEDFPLRIFENDNFPDQYQVVVKRRGSQSRNYADQHKKKQTKQQVEKSPNVSVIDEQLKAQNVLDTTTKEAL